MRLLSSGRRPIACFATLTGYPLTNLRPNHGLSQGPSTVTAMALDGPRREVAYSLEESLELLAALEDARDVLADSDHLAVLHKSSIKRLCSAVNLVSSNPGVEMAAELLRASEAARRLGIGT